MSGFKVVETHLRLNIDTGHCDEIKMIVTRALSTFSVILSCKNCFYDTDARPKVC